MSRNLKPPTLPHAWMTCLVQATPYSTLVTHAVQFHLQNGAARAPSSKSLGTIMLSNDDQSDAEPLTFSVTGTVVDCALQPREIVAALRGAMRYFINIEIASGDDLTAPHECALATLTDSVKDAMLLCSGATEDSFKRASPTVMGATAQRMMLTRPVASQSATASAPLEGCLRPTLSSHPHLQLLSKPFASVNWMPLIPVISKDWALLTENDVHTADTVQVFFQMQGAAFFFKSSKKTIYGLKPSPIAIRIISSAPTTDASPSTAEPRSKKPRLVPE